MLGPVFRAYHQEQNRLVAIKLFKLDLPPERVHQLVADLETLIAIDLSHPAIAAPIATGIVSNTPFLALDFVAADSLDVVIRESGPAAATDVLRVASQLADALDTAAELGPLHGALHPRDVLVTADDVRMTGIGISAIVERAGVPAPVRRPYSAPERAAGGPWDRTADVFSLGALVFEMLSGKRMAGVGAEAVSALPDVALVDVALLQNALTRALAENPADRFATCSAFIEALGDAVHPVHVKASRKRKKASEAAPIAAPLWETEEAADAAEVAQAAANPDEDRPRESPAVAQGGEDADLFAPIAVSDLPVELFTASAITQAAVAPVAASADDAGFITELEEVHDEGAPENPLTEDDLPLSADVTRRGDERRLPGDDLLMSGSPARIHHLNVPDGPPRSTPTIADHDPHDTMRTTEERAPLTFVDQLERTRSAMWPIVLSLVVGIAIGFGAAMLMVSRDNNEGTLTNSRPLNSKEVVDPPVVPTTDATPASPPVATPSAAVPTAPAVSAPVAAPPVAAPRSDTTATPARTVPPAPAGRLIIRSTPSGARVTLDGKEAGTTPISIRDLATGNHTVRLSRDGYGATDRRVTLTPRQPSQTLAVTLSRERPAAPTPATRTAPAPPVRAAAAPTAPAAAAPTGPGSLVVDSRPPGANVFLDGRPVGTTPLTLRAVPPGDHEIAMERDGFQRWSSSVKISSGEQSKIAGSLTER